MYLEYVYETIVYYTFRLGVFVACVVYVIDTVRKWTKERRKK